MQLTHLTELLERAAFSLDEAAKQLRELILGLRHLHDASRPERLEETQGPNGQRPTLGGWETTPSKTSVAKLPAPTSDGDSAHASVTASAPTFMATSSAASTAKRLQEFWHGVSLGSSMTVGPLTIDLATREGRWHLLILAVLRGARVRERVVEETFVALVENGLAEIRRLALATPSIKADLLEVFAQKYRALGHREAKADALMANAALLQSEYGGDLHTLYLATRGEPEALIKSLQRFKQVGQVAYWICRTLKVYGVWPDLSPRATQYLDRYTDLPLQRLRHISRLEEERSGSGTMRFVTQYLQGDTIPLYLHGLVLCSQDQVSTCLSECPLVAECGFPQKAE